LHRKQYYPLYPSRLSALYAFGDYETCELVAKKYGWDIRTVKKFELLPSPLNRVIKANMEIISLERYSVRISGQTEEDVHQMCELYWKGIQADITYQPPPVLKMRDIKIGLVWEYLIEGVLKMVE